MKTVSNVVVNWPARSRINTDHDNAESALCLSRTHCVAADEDTLAEFRRAAVAVINGAAPQPAFFLARQLAELTLKALHGPGFPFTHNLTMLLERLSQRGDELLAGGTEENLVAAFVRDLDQYDESGDQGRYPATLSGDPSLATVCCADPVLLREHVDRLYGYAQRRLAARASTGSAPQ